MAAHQRQLQGDPRREGVQILGDDIHSTWESHASRREKAASSPSIVSWYSYKRTGGPSWTKGSRRNSLNGTGNHSKRPSAQLPCPSHVAAGRCCHHTAVSALKCKTKTQQPKLGQQNQSTRPLQRPSPGRVRSRGRDRRRETEGADMIRIALRSRSRRNYCPRQRDRRSCRTVDSR